ncbi:Gas vesicle synthesis GvpLGvpF [Oscillochloris trichoides DG-6]|uniref:Gas vesicle synthesis GvpLGvpF n=1 Tax=Oscillochloris trichoides DG-6 TaxID=765420 RepID=E1IGU6_9CHLR|nr:GvpL/GvpF family gas vesicle protein [Oscillochloris trichoides]EFO79421.1 Gas vesicle synthesis GvpLGvpF [Oscillochloris trichoides DG-6]
MIDIDQSTGKYLYAIIRCSEIRVIAARGIHEDGPRVYTIPYRDVAAVVSDSPCEEYESSRRNMLAHTRVLEAVMQQYTVLPISFGMVAPDTATICDQMLARSYDDLVSQLNDLDGRIELGLKVFWTDEQFFREIADEEPAIRELRDSIVGKPAERTYYERIRLGEMVEAAIAQRRDADSERILSTLRPLAQALITQPILTDRMVVNAAFLLKREDEARFDAAVRDLDAQFGTRMLFKCVGPVPPYNFVNLTMSWS